MISKLNRIVQNFVTPKSSSLTIFELSKTRETGGDDILDIPLYLQLLYTKQLNQYYLCKSEQYDRLTHLLLMEYNAGRLFSSKLGLKISNTKPHLLEPSYFCKQFLEVMKKYNIGKNEIQTMKLRPMYHWIIEKRKSQILISSINFSISETWKQIYNDILPNYLKTFIYKLTWNLMPVKLKPHIAAYHQTNMCSFCYSSEETVSRLFLTCVNPLRDNVTRVLHEVFSKNLSSNSDIEFFFLLI